MKNKAIIIAVVILILSSFAGVSLAQDNTQTPDDPVQSRNFLRGILSLVAEETGFTGEELISELRDGATLTEVIENNGGDASAVIEQVEARISEQINEVFNTEFELNERAGNIRDRIHNGVVGELASAVSEATGLEPREIMMSVRDGATIAELIEENGGDTDTVVDSVVESVTTALEERVSSGQITQEQADTVVENLEETIISWIDGDIELPNRGHRGRGNNN